ncbi:hypothetical protein Lesp02_38440 [Lentzea sp. NBRC 105346]|uniref:asparagine synthase-related protein n=1 Tax=Lentzea sp. NBRC 105346 TaxID=3032205 RepID=UPI0024A32B33|nr:asparagine synthase-related protein [Lentzea sp. NBRC 105346]GLZ31656.1 hypothetical protein Lesp02_38440 [Lentzea sp. NBRC 105346]
MRDTRCGRSWFVVLPDHESASAVSLNACRRVAHPSGRPWLLGCWDDDFVLSVTGRRAVAVIGTSSVTPDELARCDLDAVLTGSAHVVASIDGRVRVQGTVSGVRRVFHTRLNGMTVASDTAGVLASLTGAPLDDEWAATRLLYPALPHPVHRIAPWRGVETVPEDCYLTLDDARVTRRWSPPAPELGLREGAAGLRDALLAAVATRVRPGEPVAADLSGGMDSTSICFAAAQAGARLVTVTLDWGSGGTEDARHADLAATAFGNVERIVRRTDDLPAFFDDVGSRSTLPDHTLPLVRERAQQRVIARELRARGARVLLRGHGGDHVVMAPSSYVHTLLRREPLTALRHIRAFRALERWPLLPTLKSLWDNSSYSSWLAGTAERLTTPFRTNALSMEDWGFPVLLPPWATPAAAELVRDVIRRAASVAEELAPGRGQHGAVFHARNAGQLAAQVEQGHGMAVAAPFCDDRVIEACLAVRLPDRSNPWQFKPLLAEAMRGLVPDAVLARRTKDNTNAQWHDGLRRNRAALAALVDESPLAERGLVDRSVLRRAVLSPELARVPPPALENTIACDVWLRDLEGSHVRSPAC